MLLADRPSSLPAEAQAPDARQWSWLWWPTVLGTIASLVVAAACSLPDSPFKLDAAGTWYFGEPARGGVAVNVPMLLAGSFAGFLGLATMVKIWVRLVGALRTRPDAPLWRLGVLLASWSAPMLVVAPLFSRDLYSYAAQGEMVTRHINPYLHGPSALGNSVFARPVDKYWTNAPTPYGPLFLELEGLAVRLAGHNELLTLVLLRLLAVCGVVLLAVAIPRIARLLGYDPGLAFAVGAASPLVVFMLVAGGHNDALMAGLLAVGALCALAGRKIWAIVIFACAAAIKAPALLAVVVLAWTWNGTSTPVRVRAIALAGSLGLSTGILALWSLVSGFGFGWIKNLASPGAVTSWAAPATWLGDAFGSVGHLAHLPVSTGDWLGAARLAGVVLMVAFFGDVLLRIDRFGFVRTLGLMLLALVALSPVVQPWYLIWGLALLACVPGLQALRICLVVASIAPFMGLPGGAQLAVQLARYWPMAIAALLVGAALIWLMPVGVPSGHSREGIVGRALLVRLA